MYECLSFLGFIERTGTNITDLEDPGVLTVLIYLFSLKILWKFYTSCTLLVIERGTTKTHPLAENEVPSHRMLQLFQVVFRHHTLRSLASDTDIHGGLKQAELANRLRGIPTATAAIVVILGQPLYPNNPNDTLNGTKVYLYVHHLTFKTAQCCRCIEEP